ncbi:hypothetical protein, partial [Hyphomonas sp.]|uniref:hypothetical protein n=1 Tax=Hyphomonas sp. TaxID=87 RepID=UPI0025C37920
TRFLRIRNNIHFRRYFDAVHPVFWPVLFWQLGRFFKWMRAEQLSEVLFEITWWGGVRIHIIGDKLTTPSPFAPTKPRWDDPVWASDMPASLIGLNELSAWHALILPCVSGGFPGSEIAPRFPREGIRDQLPNTS